MLRMQARSTLINARGLLESTFTAGPFAMPICAEAYKGWRFRDEALPADLINRSATSPCSICQPRWEKDAKPGFCCDTFHTRHHGYMCKVQKHTSR